MIILYMNKSKNMFPIIDSQEEKTWECYSQNDGFSVNQKGISEFYLCFSLPLLKTMSGP